VDFTTRRLLFYYRLLRELQITTKEDKKNVTVILSRLQAEGLIEKYGEKRGVSEG